MKKIITLLLVLALSLCFAACGTTQAPTAETAAVPTTIPTTVPETTQAPKELIFYDSYHSSLPHLPVPESFVDVSIDESGYSNDSGAFQYFPAESDVNVEDLVSDYFACLPDYGITPMQGTENMVFLYSVDTIVGAVETMDSSFYVYCVVQGDQNVSYDAQTISLSETAASAFAEITPNAVATGTQVSASDELFETTITARDGSKCLIWLDADLHNLTDSRVELQYNYYVRFLLDENEPLEAKLVAAPMLPPKGEKNLTWYAEIPKAYLENCRSMTIRIGFLDQFQNMNQGDLGDESALLCDVVLTQEQIDTLKNSIAE